jgi:hypothetical protein
MILIRTDHSYLRVGHHISSLSSSSSGSMPRLSFPFFRRFSWSAGVADGQDAARPLRMLEPCRRQLGGPRRDEDPDDER